MTYTLTLTGNEARLIFFAIKNKKCKQAENIRRKLAAISGKESDAEISVDGKAVEQDRVDR